MLLLGSLAQESYACAERRLTMSFLSRRAQLLVFVLVLSLCRHAAPARRTNRAKILSSRQKHERMAAAAAAAERAAVRVRACVCACAMRPPLLPPSWTRIERCCWNADAPTRTPSHTHAHAHTHIGSQVSAGLQVVVTQTGTDGIGHQLHGIFSCMLLPLVMPEAYAYSPNVPGHVG